MLEPAVTIAPSSLQFPLAVNKKITQHLILSHNGATALTFKVKTTSPARYGVRPPRGILPPGSEQHVAITLRAQPLLPPDALDCQDRFKVFLMPLGDESHERSLSPDSRARFLAELWDSEETAKKATIHKIKCSFTPDGVPSDGALARRGEGLRADERAPSEGASCDAGNARSACSCSSLSHALPAAPPAWSTHEPASRAAARSAAGSAGSSTATRRVSPGRLAQTSCCLEETKQLGLRRRQGYMFGMT